VTTSRVHFVVHPGMQELRAYAETEGWIAKGFTVLSIAWQEAALLDRWVEDDALAQVARRAQPHREWILHAAERRKGTTVKFAIHVGVASHLPSDIAGTRSAGTCG